MKKKAPPVPIDWRKKFLSVLRTTANVSKACKAAKTSRETAYKHRRTYPKFAQAWTQALEEATELFEDEVRHRALDRNDDKSHLLLMFELKKRRPEYRDNYAPKASTIEEAAIDPAIAAAALKAARDSHVKLADSDRSSVSEVDTQREADES